MNKPTEWTLSRYTSVVRCDSGDILLHNSFMGAIARIPAPQVESFETFLQRSPTEDMHGPSQYRSTPREGVHRRTIAESDLTNPGLKELCKGGFFVPSDLDERKLVSEILAREQASDFHIIIMAHENCNFRCAYCYQKHDRGKMRTDTVAGLKTFVDRKAKGIGSLSVSWFGGEPLLAPDVIHELSDSFMDSCERSGTLYRSGMTTNGYFLTSDVVDWLLQRQVKSYQVTLDGPEAVHNSLRNLAGGGGTYRRILDNLTQMRHRDDDFFVKIRVNFLESTVPFLESFLDELSPFFDDSRFCIDFHSVGRRGGPNDSALDICDTASTTQVKFALGMKSLEFGSCNARVAKDRLLPRGQTCYAGNESSMVVGSDGAVYKCTVALYDPRNHVGKLTETGELVIDQALWNLWTTLDGKNSNKCNQCSFSPACQGRACPLIAINQNEPTCPMSESEYTSTVKLSSAAGPVTPSQLFG